MHTLVTNVALFVEGKVLMVKYKDMEAYDGEAGWFLPNDGLAHFEHPETGAKRVLKEQLNMEAPKLALSFIESFKGMRGTWHLSFHYRADLDKMPALRRSDAVRSAEWFATNQLPDRKDVAHHGWAISVFEEMKRRT